MPPRLRVSRSGTYFVMKDCALRMWSIAEDSIGSARDGDDTERPDHRQRYLAGLEAFCGLSGRGWDHLLKRNSKAAISGGLSFAPTSILHSYINIPEALVSIDLFGAHGM